MCPKRLVLANAGKFQCRQYLEVGPSSWSKCRVARIVLCIEVVLAFHHHHRPMFQGF